MRQSSATLSNSTAQIAHIKRVQFTSMNQEEIERYAIDQIDKTKIYQNNIPVQKGLNDLRLGVGSNAEKCLTCKQTKQCPGHFGMIRLAEPIFHYGFIGHLIKVLKCICITCSRMRIVSEKQKKLLNGILKSPNSKRRLNQLSKLLQKVKICGNNDCKQRLPIKIQERNFKIFIVLKFNESQQNSKKTIAKYQRELTSAQIYKILERIPTTDAKELGFKFNKPQNMLIKTLLVCPPQVRPSIQMNPVKKSEDDLTTVYMKIIEINKRLKESQDISLVIRIKYIEALERLVNSLMNKKKSKKSLTNAEGIIVKIKEGGKDIKCITERLKGKEGRFRQNLMGKRVDFSARSVISPDSNLALDQLGVPEKIARSLTFPEQITQLNFRRIVDLCKQGKVLYILKPSKDKKKYQPFDATRFQDLQGSIEKQLNYGMIAERCLEDGDYILFNRQPTLHRMSMMCHRVKILPHSTFRLNLSVCTPYNADFDGDEMNLHVPQSYQTLAQLKHITHVPKQIVTPKNNSPVMGIVQDALLGVYLFTLRDTFLTKQQVMNLVIWIQDFSGDFPMPAILKPEPLWTGKQVMSLIIPKTISMINIKDDQAEKNPKDISMIIKKGELLTGALTKEIVGPSAGGLIHTLWLEIGAQVTSVFMTTCQRIINNWLVSYGFSCGASDVVPTKKCKQKITKEREQINKTFIKNYLMFFSTKKIESQNLHNKSKRIMESLQVKINQHLNKSLKDAKNIIEETTSPYRNSLYKMIWAKSKGNQTNLTQILGFLGNQNVDGKRLPQGFKNRSLCHFYKDDFSPQPRGFIFSSFFKGLKPHEFFFHSMSGRQGLSDTAVKTSRTGYIQRKLIKALQDVIVKYDGTVRDSQSNLIQRFYGEDGLSSQYIEKQRIPALQMDDKKFQNLYRWHQIEQQIKNYESGKINRMSFLHQSVYKDIQIQIIQNWEFLEREYELVTKARKRLREVFIQNTQKDIYTPIKIDKLIMNIKIQKKINQFQKCQINPITVFERTEQALQQIIPSIFLKEYEDFKLSLKEYSELSQAQKKEYNKRLERFEKESGQQLFRIHVRLALASKIICLSHKLTEQAFCQLLDQIKYKYKHSIIHPGQTIGAIAAQSVGQPTTQMTLNTFHLAGVSQNNVTLGVPRMQQLLDASKKMKTPSLKIILKKEFNEKKKEDIAQLSNLMANQIPERFLGNYITSSKVYFDPDPLNSKIFNEEADDLKDQLKEIDDKDEKITPWVLLLEFDKENKVQMYDVWEQIKECVSSLVQQICHFSSNIFLNDVLYIKLRLKGNISLNQLEENNKNKFKLLEMLDLNLRKHKLGTGIKKIKKVFKKSQKIVRISQTGQLESVNKLVLQTQGSNLRQILSKQYVDYTKTYSNDIIEILNVLGIEAARQSFLNQFRLVLQPYNIYINLRHIITLSDWMTRRGKLTPINRNGINRISEVSVLRKASFQETVEMLFDAAISEQIDYLRGISERIIFGETCQIGTGHFQLVIDRSKAQNVKKIFQKDKPYLTMENNQYQDGYRPRENENETPCIRQTPYIHYESTVSRSPGPDFGISFTPTIEKYGSSFRQASRSPRMQSPVYPAYNPLSNSSRSLSPTSESRNNFIQRTPGYLPSLSPGSITNQFGASSQRYISSSPSYQSHFSHPSATYDSQYGQGSISPGYGNSSRHQTPNSHIPENIEEQQDDN